MPLFPLLILLLALLFVAIPSHPAMLSGAGQVDMPKSGATVRLAPAVADNAHLVGLDKSVMVTVNEYGVLQASHTYRKQVGSPSPRAAIQDPTQD